MTAEHLYVLLGIGVVIAGFLGWLFKRAVPSVRHFIRRLNGMIDAIGGRDAYVDPASGRRVERLLPLTTRVATIEEALIQIAEDRTATLELSKRVANVETRVGALEKAAVDRVATKIENASAMSMIARLQDDYVDVDPDELHDADSGDPGGEETP